MIRGHYVFLFIMKLNKTHICKYCGKEFDKGVQLGGHIRLCPNNPKYKENFQKCCIENNSQRGKHHTEEQKRKVSESRKKYLLEHPEKVPYVLNHHSKGDSYPEKYFKSVFDERRLPDMYIYWLSEQWNKNNTIKARVTSSDMYQEDVLFYYGDDDKTVYIHGEYMPVSEDFKEFRKRMNS